MLAENKHKPFIIWTFRRTGGTNLGQALFKESQYDTVEHEPFNLDRCFGYVHAEWRKDKDIEKMRASVEAILAKKVLIKHCLELMPLELNRAIAEISSKLGYQHLFLYREFPTDRLLSLNYARQTNVWGKDQLRKYGVDEKVFNNAIPTKELITHELNCRQSMALLFNFLSEKKAKPLAVSFESLYQSGFEYSSSLVLGVFDKLGLSKKSVTHGFLNSMLKRGGQGTKNDYLRFQGSEDFITKAKQLPRFTLYDLSLTRTKVVFEKGNLLYTEVWELLPDLELGHFYLSGIALAADDVKAELSLFVDGKHSKVEFTQGLKSPRIETKYPDNKNSSHSRFLSEPFKLPSQVIIQGRAL